MRVVGMHLDLSGLHRRQQLRSVLFHLSNCDHDVPGVLMNDFNEWARRRGCFREFGSEWQVLAPGKSYPTRRPVAFTEWQVIEARVHHSALAARGSDHLPVQAALRLPNS
jgi:endonuclease/exonuclease/phosphatase family metal-dependent hydrolase